MHRLKILLPAALAALSPILSPAAQAAPGRDASQLDVSFLSDAAKTRDSASLTLPLPTSAHGSAELTAPLRLADGVDRTCAARVSRAHEDTAQLVLELTCSHGVRGPPDLRLRAQWRPVPGKGRELAGWRVADGPRLRIVAAVR